MNTATGDHALGSALNAALRRAPLSADAELRLARQAAQGDRHARDRLIEGNLRLVVAIARGYRCRGVAHVDLVQEGMTGLLQALERFDHERGYRLATYASWWIRRAMLGAIAAAPPIPLAPDGHRELAAILRTEFELTGRGRPRPDAATLAVRTGLSVRRVEGLRGAPHVVTSLDAEFAGSGTPLGEQLADPAAVEVASGVDRDEAAREVHAALSLLAPRVRRVLELRFGLLGGEGLTHEQTGKLVGITAERSRQIESDGLRRLRPFAMRASLAA